MTDDQISRINELTATMVMGWRKSGDPKCPGYLMDWPKLEVQPTVEELSEASRLIGPGCWAEHKGVRYRFGSMEPREDEDGEMYDPSTEWLGRLWDPYHDIVQACEFLAKTGGIASILFDPTCSYSSACVVIDTAHRGKSRRENLAETLTLACLEAVGVDITEFET